MADLTTDPMHGVFQGFDIAASALRAELQRSEIVAANLSNMHDTGSNENEPYRRRGVVFEEVLNRVNSVSDVEGGNLVAAGVQVRSVYVDHKSPMRHFHDPGHPDANEAGWVFGTNVDMFKELWT